MLIWILCIRYSVKCIVWGINISVLPDIFPSPFRVIVSKSVIDIVWPMEARLVLAHASIKDDVGRAAVERGPLVYCAEAIDNGGSALALAIPQGADFRSEWRADLLNGVVVLKSDPPANGRPIVLIPYYAWAHRGPGGMAVWLVRPSPSPS